MADRKLMIEVSEVLQLESSAPSIQERTKELKTVHGDISHKYHDLEMLTSWTNKKMQKMFLAHSQNIS